MRQARVYYDKDLDAYLVTGTRRPNNRIYATADEAQRAADKSNDARMTRSVGKSWKSYSEILKNKKISYQDLYHKAHTYTSADGSKMATTVISASDVESGDSGDFKKTEANNDMKMGTAFVALYHETWDNNGTRSLYDIAKNKALLKRVALVMWNEFTSEEKKALEVTLNAIN